jgi:hypothetical protein
MKTARPSTSVATCSKLPANFTLEVGRRLLDSSRTNAMFHTPPPVRSNSQLTALIDGYVTLKVAPLERYRTDISPLNCVDSTESADPSCQQLLGMWKALATTRPMSPGRSWLPDPQGLLPNKRQEGPFRFQEARCLENICGDLLSKSWPGAGLHSCVRISSGIFPFSYITILPHSVHCAPTTTPLSSRTPR